MCCNQNYFFSFKHFRFNFQPNSRTGANLGEFQPKHEFLFSPKLEKLEAKVTESFGQKFPKVLPLLLILLTPILCFFSPCCLTFSEVKKNQNQVKATNVEPRSSGAFQKCHARHQHRLVRLSLVGNQKVNLGVFYQPPNATKISQGATKSR